MNSSKDRKWLLVAETFANKFSKDPGTKCGAIIVDKRNRIVSIGYNGFPSKIVDKEELLNNRPKKLERTIHAELNAILNAKTSLEGCTIYQWPMPPCSHCALCIIQAGIEVVAAPYVFPEKWRSSIDLGIQLFLEANIDYHYYSEEFLK
jgi:dCMP deaminase